MKTVQFDTFHNKYVFHNWLVEFSFICLRLFLEIGLKHEWTVYLVLSDVLCTVRCTLYFLFWKYKVHRTVHQYVGINIYSTGNKKRVQSTSESTFMYFRMYSVLSIVLCTFKCTLKGTRCTLNNVGKQDFTFSKNQKNTSIMHAHAFFCMSTSISTRVHTFPKVLTQILVNERPSSTIDTNHKSYLHKKNYKQQLQDFVVEG